MESGGPVEAAPSFPAAGGAALPSCVRAQVCLQAPLRSTGHRFCWVSLFGRRPLGGENQAPGCPGLRTSREGVLCRPNP